MDLVFGDTAAHEEKERLRQIEAQLRGVDIEGDDLKKEAGVTNYRHDESV